MTIQLPTVTEDNTKSKDGIVKRVQKHFYSGVYFPVTKEKWMYVGHNSLESAEKYASKNKDIPENAVSYYQQINVNYYFDRVQ